MRIHRHASAALLLGAALLGACGDPSSSGDTPSVGYRYSGAASGQFSLAAGRRAAGTRTLPFVEGVTPVENGFVVNAVSMSDGRVSALAIAGPSAPGEYALPTCGGVALCPSIAGAIGSVDAEGNNQEGGRAWSITSGTLTLLRPNRDGWVRGRFSGTAAVSVYRDGAWRDEGTLTITDGSFEADLVERRFVPD